MSEQDPDFRLFPPWVEDWLRILGMLLVLLLAAVLVALPAIVTDDMRCLFVRTFECRYWWLP